MTAALIAAPASEPVSVAQMKAHLRLSGSAEDDFLQDMITAAREHVERETRRSLISQTWRLYLDRWPMGRVVPLPTGPVQEVSQVLLYDRVGAASDLAQAFWSLSKGSDPARVKVLPGAGLSITELSAIEIDFIAGYGDAADTVPATLRQAVRLLAAHWFENREAGTELSMASLPFGLDRLLSVNRIPQL
ncbi:phage head-tail connector protein [Roseibium sp. CAU 1637]|uniref:Phage head-tail connector protein n=1 Tax=Roseibium limicola TaxID=2816037 RepID=A0A939J8D4_9HYPH|nr:head-tail connector protein [Roseibium limicola]MBO0345201.1 phage head-tail connector protein [Roseibium limicola]